MSALTPTCRVILELGGTPTPCVVVQEHQHCPRCTLVPPGGAAVCRTHDASEAEWHTANKAMCDFLHRRTLRVRGERPPPAAAPDDGGIESPWEM